jgi:hypothetical protein
MGSGTIPPEGRGEGGKFAKGNPGGPGRRPGRSPLHKAVSNEKAEELWRARVVVAEGLPQARGSDEAGYWDDYSRIDAAAEFILRYKNGTPAASVPDLPCIDWPPITCVEDLMGAFNAVLGAQRSGDLDGAGLAFLTDMLIKFARIYETIEMAPRLRRLEEHMAAQAAAQGNQ